MNATGQPADAAMDGHSGTDPAESVDADSSRTHAVSVRVLVAEATETGVVDWIADQIRERCAPHGIPLEGPGGLLPALAAAAYARVRSAGPVRIELAYDTDRQSLTANLAPGTSLATLGKACMAIAHTAADLHPVVTIQRDDGVPVRR